MVRAPQLSHMPLGRHARAASTLSFPRYHVNRLQASMGQVELHDDATHCNESFQPQGDYLHGASHEYFRRRFKLYVISKMACDTRFFQTPESADQACEPTKPKGSFLSTKPMGNRQKMCVPIFCYTTPLNNRGHAVRPCASKMNGTNGDQ